MRNWLLITALWVCVASPQGAAAKSYAVSSVHVSVETTTDALLVIEEELTYRFDGSFSYVYRDIPLKRGESVSDITVSEHGGLFRNESGKEPGTFSTSRQGSNLRVTWYYRARNETRTFTLKYTMSGAITRYSDVAELYFQFIGDGWDHPIGEVTVRVSAPDGTAASDVRAWAHGPLHGAVEIVAGGGVNLDVAPLPAHTFWEGRILYSSAAFPGVSQRGGEALARIMEEERVWVETANRQREARMQQRKARVEKWEKQRALAEQLLPVSVLLGMAGLVMWFMLFRRHGKAHDVQSRVAPGDIPSDHPPAVVSYLALSRNVGGTAIVATLLDLANRGYLEIKETVEIKSNWFGQRRKADYEFHLTEKPVSELIAYERDLLDFLLNVAGTGMAFTMSGLKKAASKHRTKFRKWFMAWVKQVKDYAKTFEFYEPFPVGPMLLNGLAGVAIAGAGGVITAVTESPAGVPAIALGLLQAILTVTLTRHTPDGRRLALAWRDFRVHLQKTSKAMGPVKLTSREWGRYLGAAILFGMHKKLIPHLQIVDDRGQTALYPVWYYGALDSSSVDNLAGLADGFSTMVSSVSTTMSSASGTGGGASGGGGGGSGGGGGGAG